MALYFITINGKKEGPFMLSELKSKSLNRNDLVWKEGEKNWLKASDFEELSDLFTEVPPPLPTFSKDNFIQKTSNLPISLGVGIGAGILVLIICFMLFQPFKFNTDEYKNAKNIYSNDFNTPILTNSSEIPGFFDYGDNETGWNPSNKQGSFEQREEYLTNKALKYSLIALVIGFILTFAITTMNTKSDNDNQKTIA